MATLVSSLEFKQEIEQFLRISEHVGDTWSIKVVDKSDYSTYYLCRTKYIKVPEDKVLNKLHGDSLNSEYIYDIIDSIEDEDSCTVSIEDNKLNLRFEHHVLYSSSFCVPVLYFNCYKEDGSSLSLEELWKTVPLVHQSQITDNQWTTLTQTQHPLLGFPFFHLHPCHTADLMKACQRPPGCNYIMNWLSSVGPVAHVDLPVDYLLASEKLKYESSTAHGK